MNPTFQTVTNFATHHSKILHFWNLVENRKKNSKKKLSNFKSILREFNKQFRFTIQFVAYFENWSFVLNFAILYF
jgi:hypothetical protein